MPRLRVVKDRGEALFVQLTSPLMEAKLMWLVPLQLKGKRDPERTLLFLEVVVNEIHFEVLYGFIQSVESSKFPHSQFGVIENEKAIDILNHVRDLLNWDDWFNP